jgi:hypothetical protein
MAKKSFVPGEVLRAADVNEYLTSSKNLIINGAFEINQRNFTSTTTSGAFGHDRWSLETATGTVTYSTQGFTPGTSLGTDEPSNFARIITTGQSGAGALTIFRQKIEDVRAVAGQAVTVSFWAKAASGTPKLAVEINQNFGAGGSPSAGVNTYAGQVTLSTGWARYSVTVNVPTALGKTLGTTANTSFTQLSLWLSGGSDFNSRTGSIGIQSNTFDIWGVQVEEGSTATPFSRNSPSIAAELLACQRYYYSTLVSNPWYVGIAFIDVEDSSWSSMTFPTIMRATPTVVMSVEGVANRVRSFGGLPTRTVSGYIPTPYGLNFLYHDGGYTVGRAHAGQLTANAEL